MFLSKNSYIHATELLTKKEIVMKKLVVLLFAVMIGFAAVPSTYAAPQGTIVAALKGVSPTMDPHPKSNFIGAMIWKWCYDTLIGMEAGTGKKLPWLATKWKVHSPRKLELWLRKGVKFTDGTTFTAKNVEFAFSRIMAKGSRQRVFFKALERVEIVNDYQVILHSKPDNGMLNRLARWGHAMSLKAKGVDKKIISRKTLYGSGPYILTEWAKGRKMVFDANPNWWANSKYPNRPKKVILRGIKSSVTRVKALQKGEIDLVMGILPQYIPQIEKNPKLAVADIPAVRMMFISFVTRNGGPFADQNVRLAANYAIDAELLRTTFLAGKAVISGSLFHPWNYAGYNKNDKWHGYDLKKAKAYMAKSKYPKGFKATVYATIGRYPGDVKTCEALGGFFKEIGIKATCRTMPYSAWKKKRKSYQKGKGKGEAAVFVQGYGNSGGDPGNIAPATGGCKGHSSVHCFKDLDVQIDKAKFTADPKQQQIEFEKVTAMMKEKAIFKILYKTNDIYAYKKGFGFNPRHDESFYVWEIDMSKVKK